MYSGANMRVLLSECDETYSSDDEEEEGWAVWLAVGLAVTRYSTYSCRVTV